METQLSTEAAKHWFCKEALARKNDLERNYLELGAMLYRIKEERLFEAGWSSWDEYAMELKMSQSSVSRMLRIYELFVIQYKFPVKALARAGGWTVLGDLLPSIKDDTTRDEVQSLIDLAGLHNRTDLQRTLKETRRAAPCQHHHTRKLVLIICEDCNERWSEGHDHEK